MSVERPRSYDLIVIELARTDPKLVSLLSGERLPRRLRRRRAVWSVIRRGTRLVVIVGVCLLALGASVAAAVCSQVSPVWWAIGLGAGSAALMACAAVLIWARFALALRPTKRRPTKRRPTRLRPTRRR